MKALENTERLIAQIALASLIILSASVFAQVPVDEDGNAIGDYESPAAEQSVGNEDAQRLSETELQELVGPVALYPDDLLAIVLPASAYPLQIVAAARFLEALKVDPTLKPDPEWDDSIVALINYPEVVELLNKDIEWTRRLGEAVVAYQADVVAAVETFRDRAYAAGNLKSDEYQTVAKNEGVIEITPVADDVIYVPYYEPARVVVYQPRPAYYYYPSPYPVYYYPYSAHHYFHHGFFWGVTTAFSIGWHSDSLHVFHHSYHGHPFYGHHYRYNWWYRRPSIHSHNTTYFSHSRVTVNRYSEGDRWHAREERREYVVRESNLRRNHRNANRDVRSDHRSTTTRNTTTRRQHEPITFRERPGQPVSELRDNTRLVSQLRDNTRQVPARRTTARREQAVRGREPRQRGQVVREREPQQRGQVVRERESRQREHAPMRREHVQREPRRHDAGRTESRHVEPRRTEQPPRTRESHSSERAESSAGSGHRQKESRSRSREKRH